MPARLEELAEGEAAAQPNLPDLLEKSRNHVMTDEEREAQRQSWARGEAAMGESAAEPEAGAREDARTALCFWCHADFPYRYQGTPEQRADDLTAHTMECRNHPMNKIVTLELEARAHREREEMRWISVSPDTAPTPGVNVLVCDGRTPGVWVDSINKHDGRWESDDDGVIPRFWQPLPVAAIRKEVEG